MVRFNFHTSVICCALVLFSTACSKKKPVDEKAQVNGGQPQETAPPIEEMKPVKVTLAAGQADGIYYATGEELIRLLKECAPDLLAECSVVSSEGSVDNINKVVSGTYSFGLAQSDQQYEAVQGMSVWADAGPQENLRALFSIYPESVTIISLDAAGIDVVTDLKGKKVSLGELGSGTYQNALDVLQTAGIDPESDLESETIPLDDALVQLKDGVLDAVFLTTGHPSDVIRTLLEEGIKIRLVGIEHLANILTQKPYYSKTHIPLNMYPELSNNQDITTVGIQATLVTSADLPNELAYAMAKGFIDNLEIFRTLNPVYKSLTYASALQAITAPLHPGAIQYYTEVAPDIIQKSNRGFRP